MDVLHVITFKCVSEDFILQVEEDNRSHSGVFSSFTEHTRVPIVFHYLLLYLILQFTTLQPHRRGITHAVYPRNLDMYHTMRTNTNGNFGVKLF